jgi:hypothetical protein
VRVEQRCGRQNHEEADEEPGVDHHAAELSARLSGSALERRRPGLIFCSSTSSAARQKNKQGLIVVPKIATTAVIDSRDRSNDGTKVAARTRCYGYGT